MTPARGGDLVDLAATCLSDLEAAGATLATAESLTAGLVASTLASVPGASTVLRGGVAAYATDVKVSVLGLDPTIVSRFGVISAECAEAMATRAGALFSADWAVSTTGVAGPDPQDGHPAGEVYVAVASPSGAVSSRRLDLAGSRQQIREATVFEVLALLHSLL